MNRAYKHHLCLDVSGFDGQKLKEVTLTHDPKCQEDCELLEKVGVQIGMLVSRVSVGENKNLEVG